VPERMRTQPAREPTCWARGRPPPISVAWRAMALI